MIKKLLIALMFVFMIVGCQDEVSQYNDWMVGTWSFNDNTEYIKFMEDDVFIMNDSIQGSYEVQEEDDNEIWFYAISKSGNSTDYGIMICEDIFRDHMEVTDLPFHKGETFVIYKK